MEALPAPLNWLTISLPVAEQASLFAAIEQLPGPGGKQIFGATAAWVLPPRTLPANAGVQVVDEPLAQSPNSAPSNITPTLSTDVAAGLAATATAADATMIEAATRLERYGKAEAAAAPPALARMGLRPEAVRELRLSMDPATLAGRVAGSRPVMSWRAIELGGATPTESALAITGVIARLGPTANGGGSNASIDAKSRAPNAMLRWTLTPLPQLPVLPAASQPPEGSGDPPVPNPASLPLGEDVISQGLLCPGVLSPMIEAPGQTGLADILRTIELIRWRITTVPAAGHAEHAGARRRIEIEVRQSSGKDAGGK